MNSSGYVCFVICSFMHVSFRLCVFTFAECCLYHSIRCIDCYLSWFCDRVFAFCGICPHMMHDILVKWDDFFLHAIACSVLIDTFTQLNFTVCLSIRLALLCCPRPRSGSGLPLLPRLACPPAAAAACLPGLPRPVAFLPPSWPFWGLPFSDRLCTLARFSKASCWFWSCLRHAWIRNVLYNFFVSDPMDPLGYFLLTLLLCPH